MEDVIGTVNTEIDVIAVQVLPFKYEGDQKDAVKQIKERINIVAQFEGPNEETVGYGVYLRLRNGSASWIADRDTPEKVMEFAGNVAKLYEVTIEENAFTKQMEGKVK